MAGYEVKGTGAAGLAGDGFPSGSSTDPLSGAVGAHSQQMLVFRGHNFPVWKARVRARLQAAGLLYVLDGDDASAAAVAVGDGGATGSQSPQERKRTKAGTAAVGGVSQDSLQH